jgi:hypothetical protein
MFLKYCTGPQNQRYDDEEGIVGITPHHIKIKKLL